MAVVRGEAAGGEVQEVRGVERDGGAGQHGGEGRVRPGVRGGGAQHLRLRRPRRVPPLRGLRELCRRRPAPVPARGPRLPRRRRPPDRARVRRALPLRLGPRVPDDGRRRARRLLLSDGARAAPPIDRSISGESELIELAASPKGLLPAGPLDSVLPEQRSLQRVKCGSQSSTCNESFLFSWYLGDTRCRCRGSILTLLYTCLQFVD